MALLTSHKQRISMLLIVALCLILNVLSGVSALSLSIPPHTHNMRFSAQVGATNKLFGIPSTQHHLSQCMSAATNNDNISLNSSPKQWTLLRLSKISQQLIYLRKSIFKAATILSLVLFGFNTGVISTPPHAHAAWGSKSSVVIVETPPVVVKKASLVRKMTKLLVTAGAVSVGMSVVPNSVGSSSSTIDGEDDDRVESKDKLSPLPLPTENLELISKPKISSKILKPPKQTNTNTSKKDPILVKDLDSKIEMLRIREENAKASAEEKRIADLERATEVRKQEQAEIEKRIAAEADKVKKAQRQKAILAEKQREEELSKLESGKKFQQIKEQMSDDGGMVLEDVTSMIKKLPKKQEQTSTTPVVRKMGSSGPARTKEEDIELTTQVILEYVRSKEGDEAGVVDDQ